MVYYEGCLLPKDFFMETTPNTMNYTEWLEEGKRFVVKRALKEILKSPQEEGNSVYLTFRTDFPTVSIPGELYEQYPEEMTISLNDSCWNLMVDKDFFSVELLFDGQRKKIKVPFESLVNFIDPSVEFALQFDWEALKPKVSLENVIFLKNHQKDTK